jgi:hypothetical protein
MRCIFSSNVESSTMTAHEERFQLWAAAEDSKNGTSHDHAQEQHLQMVFRARLLPKLS